MPKALLGISVAHLSSTLIAAFVWQGMTSY